MKPTVLVIDDEKTFRIVAEEALSARGVRGHHRVERRRRASPPGSASRPIW